MKNNNDDPRKHKRIQLQDGVVALSFDSVCQITDISQGGVSLKCYGKGKVPEKWSMDILMKGSLLYAEQIPVKLAWSKDIRPSSNAFYSTSKAIGAKFEGLDEDTKAIMESMIEKYENL